MNTRLLIAWLCNLVDTLATLHLHSTYVGTELNPISAFLLQSPVLFAVVKLLTMTVAIVCIWLLRDKNFFRVASWILCIEYAAVVIYYAIVYAFIV